MTDVTTSIMSYKCTPRQTRKFAIRALEAGLVPYVRSSPGMGKSAIFKSIAEEFNLELIDHRLSTSAPEDLSGLANFVKKIDPETGKEFTVAQYVPFDTFPIEGTPIPEGKSGWLLFLDEINAANKSVIAAAYKLILDKAVGLNKLHPKVFIAAAGNLDTDRAITNMIGTAMESRVIHIEMVLNHREFIEDVCYKYDWDERIIAYFEYDRDAYYDFRPDHNDKTFSCPRTWEFMNNLVKGRSILEEDTPLYAGTIASGNATRFVQFTECYSNLPKINDILHNPDGHPIPDSKPLKFATMVMLQNHVDDVTMNEIGTYVSRFPTEFRIVFFRGLLFKKPELREHPGMRKAIVEVTRYLYG